MKTIKGTIVSSRPVAVTKAADFISKFVKDETGASQAVGAYLRRATAAFEELVRAESESRRKRGNMGEEMKDEKVGFGNSGGSEGRIVNEAKGERRSGVDGEGKMVVGVKEEERLGEESEGKKKKKNKRERGGFEDNGSVVRDREGNSESKIRIKEEEEESGKNGNVVYNGLDKNGIKEREGQEEKRLKRKSEEVGEEREVGTEERKQGKKKKKRRGGENGN